jgi:hypothetical protein
MIVIRSTSRGEPTSSAVTDWILHSGGQCVRLNGEDLGDGRPYTLRVSNERATFSMVADGKEVALEDAGAVFYRGRSATLLPSIPALPDARLHASLLGHMKAEIGEVGSGVDAFFDAAFWVPHRSRVGLDKITGMLAARACGLEIPPSLVTTSRAEALSFLEEHRDVVVKSLSSGLLRGEQDNYSVYTSRVTFDDLAGEGPLFPTLFQAYVPKQYEIRAFYLDGGCDSMAIFSQLDPQTSVDFRRYNWSRQNRCVPVRLPTGLESRIRGLMDKLGLSTGSLDLIKRPDGRYVFLEVNPVGQFGFISSSGNLQLEKKVAWHLMARDGQPVRDPWRSDG